MTGLVPGSVAMVTVAFIKGSCIVAMLDAF